MFLGVEGVTYDVAAGSEEYGDAHALALPEEGAQDHIRTNERTHVTHIQRMDPGRNRIINTRESQFT